MHKGKISLFFFFFYFLDFFSFSFLCSQYIKMFLYIIGLGIYVEKDISLRGLEILKNSDKVYAENYTNFFAEKFLRNLERIIGRRITLLSRSDLEERVDSLLKKIVKGKKDVALLVPGDPMIATTHVSIILKANELGIKTKVIHGISIVSASAGLAGLQIYKFGKIVSIVKPSKNYFPLSPYDAIKENLKMGMHTLLLLDITNDCMTANEAMEILLEMEKRKKEGIIKDDTLIVVLARVSSDDALVRAGYIKDLINEDFGKTPHCMILPGKLHFMEAKALVYIAGAPEKIMDEK